MFGLRYFLSILCSSLFVIQIQAQEFEWVKFMQGSGSQRPVSMEVAPDGNQYTAYHFSGPSNFDSVSFNNSALYRACVIKQDSAGLTKWLKIFYTTNSYVWILGTALNQDGHLVILFTSNTDVYFDSNYITHPGGGDVVFMARFSGDGTLLEKDVLLKSKEILYNASNPDGEAVFIDDNNDLFFYLNCEDTLVCFDSAGSTTITPGQGVQRLVHYKQSGSKFEWVRSISFGIIKRVDTDLQGKVYLAIDIAGNGTFSFGGNSISANQNLMGAVFVLNNQGQDLNWFGITASGGRSSIHDLTIYDNQSLYISGEFLGDSALFDTLWKKTPVSGAYHFIARYKSDGSLLWIKHEDTTLSSFSIVSSGNHSMTQYFDEYIYISYLSGSAYSLNKTITYDGIAYPGITGVSTLGMNMKLDARGNILWAYRTQRHFPAMDIDLRSNLYFAGHWFSSGFQLGSYQATHQGSGDAFIGKTFDYAIFRGNISQGPYCAGDTLLVPYTIRGEYGDSNQFLAELSDENGLFIGGQRELGSVLSKDSGTISCILPLFEVVGSAKYRIRVRSTHPFVQSFYRIDTLLLLIYSRDKADPGPSDSICFGDTLMLNTFGGTKWTWSPGLQINDTNQRQPLVWPDSTRTYQIIIDDSSGCGLADTAYKTVFVRKRLKLSGPFSDTLVCPLDTIQLRLQADGGDSTRYFVSWYRDTLLSSGFMATHSLMTSTDSLAISGMTGDVSGTKYFALLGDSCSEIKDTLAFQVRSYLPLTISLPLLDTTLCLGSSLTVSQQTDGGRNQSYNYRWTLNGTLLDSLSAQLALDTTLNQSGSVQVKVNDGCSLVDDSASFTLNYFNALNAQIVHLSTPLGDTSLCPGAELSLSNQNTPMNGGAINYAWMMGNIPLSMSPTIVLNNDSLRQAWNVPSDSLISTSIKLNFSNQCESRIDSALIRLHKYPENALGNSAASVLDSATIAIHFDQLSQVNIRKYRLYRILGSQQFLVDSGAYSPTVSSQSFTDTFTQSGSLPCYRVETVDSCGNSKFSEIFCTQGISGSAQQLENSIFWNLDTAYVVEAIWLWNGMTWDSLSALSAQDSSYTHTQLACNTEYRYRISFLSANQRRHYSAAIKLYPFDTIAPAPPTRLDISVNLSQQAVLSWPAAADSDVTSYEIWKNTGSGYQLYEANYRDTFFIDLIANVNNISASYSIISIDSCGNGNRSIPSDSSAAFRVFLKTGGCDPFIEVNWESYFGFNGSTPTYNVYRTEDGNNYTLIHTSLLSSNAFIDSTVQNNRWYSYRIEAWSNTYQVGIYSDTASLSSFTFPVPAMGKMQNVSVSNSGVSGQIEINWLKWDMSDSFARGYYLWYLYNGTPSLIHTEADLNTTQFIHSPVDVDNSSHGYILSTYNLCMEDTSVLFRQSEPSMVHRNIWLQAENNNLQAAIFWSPYEGFIVDEYEVWRSEDNAPEERMIVLSQSDSNWFDSSVRCGHTYRYRIYANEQMGGHHSWSNEAVLLAYDTIAPEPVSIRNATVTQSSSSAGEIQLSLTGSINPNAHYLFLYHKNINGQEVLIDSLPNNSNSQTSFSHDQLNTATYPYSYWVRVKDSCGNMSIPSDTFKLVNLRTVAVNNAIRLSWTPHKGFGSWTYTVQRQNADGTWFNLTELDSAQLNYTDSMVRCLTVYSYRVLSIDRQDGRISTSNIDLDSAFSNDLPAPPSIDLITVIQTGTQGRIQIDWPLSPTKIQTYILERSEDSLNWVEVFRGYQSQFINQDIATNQSAYYYRLRILDSCLNTSVNPSALHRSIYLQATAGEEKIELSWTPYLGWLPQYYRIYRNNLLLDSVAGQDYTYTDSGLFCTEQYEYLIEGVSFQNQLTQSNTQRSSPLDTRPPDIPEILNITVSDPNKQIELNWKPVTNFDLAGYEISAVSSTQNTKLIQNTWQESEFIDWSFSESPCFQIRSYDSCGNYSAFSSPVCVLIPKVEAIEGENKLEWNPYIHYVNGVDRYELYVSEDSINWEYVAQIPFTQTMYLHQNLNTSQSKFVYQLRVISQDNPAFESRSAVVSVVQAPIIWIPNSFTPTHSLGLNDVFKPEGAWITNYQIRVWNRWGQLIFEGEEKEGWDGKIEGEPASDGIYIYEMTVIGANENRETFRGSLTLLH